MVAAHDQTSHVRLSLPNVEHNSLLFSVFFSCVYVFLCSFHFDVRVFFSLLVLNRRKTFVYTVQLNWNCVNCLHCGRSTEPPQGYLPLEMQFAPECFSSQRRQLSVFTENANCTAIRNSPCELMYSVKVFVLNSSVFIFPSSPIAVGNIRRIISPGVFWCHVRRYWYGLALKRKHTDSHTMTIQL